MSLTLAIVLIAVLGIALIGGLAFVMSRPTKLRGHRPRGGRPAARLRQYRAGRGRS